MTSGFLNCEFKLLKLFVDLLIFCDYFLLFSLYFLYVSCFIQLQLAHMSSDMSRDELHGLSVSGTVSGGDSSSGGGASPLTARSIRLERFAAALANSQEELRR